MKDEPKQTYFFTRFVTKSLKVTDEKKRTFSGILSAEMVDKQGEIMVIDELMKVLPIWLKRGAPISDTHSNRILGRGTDFRKLKIKDYNGESYDAVEIDGYIFDDYELDRDIWEKMKSGEYKGLSFGGSTKSDRVPKVMKDGRLAYQLIDLEQYEVAVCREPAVPLAIFTKLNNFAKAVNSTDKQLNYTKKGDEVRIQCTNMGCYVEKTITPLNKPFAGYKDFAACVSSNKDKGDPEAYCATIMRQVEGVDKVSVKPDPSEEDMTPGSLAISPTGKGMVEDHATDKCPHCGYTPSSGKQSLQEHLALDHPDKLESMGLGELQKEFPPKKDEEGETSRESDSADLESVGLNPEDVNNQPKPGEEHQTHQGTSDDISNNPKYNRNEPNPEEGEINDPDKTEQSVPIETKPEPVGDIMVETPVVEKKPDISGINHPQAGIAANIENKVPGNQDPQLQDPREEINDPRAEGEFQGQAEPMQNGDKDEKQTFQSPELDPENEGVAGVTGGSGKGTTNLGSDAQSNYMKYGLGRDVGRNEDQNRNDPAGFTNNTDVKEERRGETIEDEQSQKPKKTGDVGMRTFKADSTTHEKVGDTYDEVADTRNINATPTPMAQTQNTQPPNSIGKTKLNILELEFKVKSYKKYLKS